MFAYFRLLSIMLMVLTSGDVFATGITNWDSATNKDTDKSLEFLGMLFGSVGTALSGPESGILGAVMQVFNIAVLTLGSIVVSYTIIVSTINTAQEGEVMGRKWSSAWIPLRAAMGAALLIPAPTYSLIQILFMHITVMGIHAANQIWSVALTTMSTTGGEGEIKVGSDRDLQDMAQHLFKGLVCAAVWNEGEYKGQLGAGVIVEPYIKYPEGHLWIGVPATPSMPYYANICGGLQVGAMPQNALDYSSWISTNINAFENAVNILQPAAQEAVLGDSDTWTGGGAITSAMNAIKNTLASTPLKLSEEANTGLELNVETASEHGWLYAGSYYFAFVGGKSSDQTYNPPSVVRPEADDVDNLSEEGKRVYEPGAQLVANTYILETTKDSADGGDTPNESSKLNISAPAGLSGEGQDFVKEVTGPLRDLAYTFMEHLTERYDDPVASVRAVGSEIMLTCEIIWFAIIAITFLLLIMGCINSGIQPLCFAIGSIAMVAVPLLSVLIALLWSVGCVLGIYVPMIPYLVYTFTALGWLILVIETLIAAPIVALGLVSPAQEVLGKAAPAVLLITGVFLRPSLMVIGFIGAILLVRTVVTMINFGFAATVEASITGIGVFGVIALITLYGGLILAVIHECFSLIYVIPDKILRWIGGQVEQSQVGSQVKELEKSTEKGAQIGGQLMKGSATMAGSASQGQMEGGSAIMQLANLAKGFMKEEKEDKEDKEGKEEDEKMDLGAQGQSGGVGDGGKGGGKGGVGGPPGNDSPGGPDDSGGDDPS